MPYKYSFFNDYSEGANPEIFDFLRLTNLTQESGYGLDSISEKASTLLQQAVAVHDADIHFVSSGTQANLIVLASLLKPFESVIAAQTSHINMHETGAIEATGHKINIAPSIDGKLTPPILQDVLEEHTDEHMVKPGAVFISQSTEVGTVYTKSELEALYDFCHSKKLYLYLDGARLGSALASEESKMSLADVARYTDVFYIGGTKNGAMSGEAIVITNPALKENFRFHLKQRGALLAKGRWISAQFYVLFEQGLFWENAKHANAVAQTLSRGIARQGYDFISQSTTNQIFPILPNALIETLSEHYGFYVWNKVNETQSSIRLVTSWATPQKAAEDFLQDLRAVATR